MSLKQITVTTPLLPPLEEFNEYLKTIWDRKWLTNNGYYHQLLEKELCQYLGIYQISLFTNGTIPLITALQALRINGEVITTPYSFVATTHSLWWNGIKPVFVDVIPETGNIDPNHVEAAITPKTTAIMPVHVYGNPCNISELKEIGDKYGLKIIYDAAHAFGVKINGKSILNEGNMSTLSFHATKAYNTIEGGAIVSHDPETKKRIDFLKNFGFENEISVVAPGINGKLDEIRSAFGLLSLKYIDAAIKKRKIATEKYRNLLHGIEGIRFMNEEKNIEYNYSYFPIFIDENKYPYTRDTLYEKLKANNILSRRYFYPLISSFPTYRNLDSAAESNLPIANKLANQVICLPLHHELTEDDIFRVVEVIRK